MHDELTGTGEPVYRSKRQQLKSRVPGLVLSQIYIFQDFVIGIIKQLQDAIAGVNKIPVPLEQAKASSWGTGNLHTPSVVYFNCILKQFQK